MALAQTLKGVKRELRSKGYLNELRRSQMIPGIVYGKDKQALSIAVDEKTVNRIFSHSGYGGLFSLELEGETQPVMALVREVQRHPVSRGIIHLDFLAVSMTEKITSLVPIQIVGEEEVVKQGGILQTGAKEVEVSCLPADLPEFIRCDVSKLQVGDKITIADLEVLPTVEKVSDPETVVALVLGSHRASADEPSEVSEESQGEAEASE
ncbi:MAG TPA: 50S ribosomal protein L25 [Syntrophomonadaceae bacterium]|nr:50S ribosomal protein L25 [Syntrophomonadaceae bacterium]HQA07644.1 50S ribosomal protein L25 [Syntrophomonadaceae bacterium]HQE23114.1 50S ribosomal protein L25 [Syntrophomonadaceae bacterium]